MLKNDNKFYTLESPFKLEIKKPHFNEYAKNYD